MRTLTDGEEFGIGDRNVSAVYAYGKPLERCSALRREADIVYVTLLDEQGQQSVERHRHENISIEEYPAPIEEPDQSETESEPSPTMTNSETV